MKAKSVNFNSSKNQLKKDRELIKPVIEQIRAIKGR